MIKNINSCFFGEFSFLFSVVYFAVRPVKDPIEDSNVDPVEASTISL